MQLIEAILLYVVMMAGLAWMVGRLCGMNGKYEEQSRGKGTKRAGRQDVEH
ncbi:MAG: hypothetical protein BWY21_00322 [Parcubacteria group bacterium ADurb.Bin216]|nr:MAG: hypothetical protein BWY21_00322 [Parcubacteria group bacterium ADurb.Bin216]